MTSFVPSSKRAELDRATNLLDAQTKAISLFKEIEATLLRPGVSEKQLSDEIHKLGQDRHGVRTHWHKRVVKSGPNTLTPFAENPPDRIIQEDDILVIDLGPVFEAWEADFGRTYVLGNDPAKLKLRDALQPMWEKVKRIWNEDQDMSGEQLYEIACKEAAKDGWTFGAEIAGHLIGSFPHERIPKDKIQLFIAEGSKGSMGEKGKDGLRRHYILEIHLHDKERGFGGFTEQLLTVEG